MCGVKDSGFFVSVLACSQWWLRSVKSKLHKCVWCLFSCPQRFDTLCASWSHNWTISRIEMLSCCLYSAIFSSSYSTGCLKWSCWGAVHKDSLCYFGTSVLDALQCRKKNKSDLPGLEDVWAVISNTCANVIVVCPSKVCACGAGLSKRFPHLVFHG